ncbi:MAG: ferrous iron transport protein A [Clostridia bacterium]|nr:ferrous iron transport protein A [Clostridia bacterium]
MNLSDIKLNQACYINSLGNTGNIKKRMMDLGLVEGTYVKKVLTAPFGEPSAYLVRGTVIALRSEDAREIGVRAVNENG